MDRVLKLAGATPAGLGAVTASRRRRRQPRAGRASRVRRERRRPEPARDRHAGLARRGARRAQVGGIQGQPDAERPDGRRLDRSDVRPAGPTSPPTSGPTCSISTRSAAALLRHRARRRAASRPRPRAIDTGPLRSIDGNFKLVAATLISPPLRIGNADLAATLKDGVLTISHFKGALYGGSLNFSGVVNASQPALAIDLKGDATGIHARRDAAQHARQQPVRRHHQGDDRRQAERHRHLGARQAARPPTSSGARWRAAPSSAATSLSAPTRRCRCIGSALAGAAGGVIDNTLGNALGIVGQRGLSPTALLNAIRWSSIASSTTTARSAATSTSPAAC